MVAKLLLIAFASFQVIATNFSTPSGKFRTNAARRRYKLACDFQEGQAEAQQFAIAHGWHATTSVDAQRRASHAGH
jgi:hypothetical protein